MSNEEQTIEWQTGWAEMHLTGILTMLKLSSQQAEDFVAGFLSVIKPEIKERIIRDSDNLLYRRLGKIIDRLQQRGRV